MAAIVEISPGPNFLLITRSVPGFGCKGALANSTGFACSYLLHGALAIYGVSAILATEAVLLTVIQVVGAYYLLHLGIKSFKPKGMNPSGLILTPAVDILLMPATDSVVMRSPVASTQSRMSLKLEASAPSIDITLGDDSAHAQTESLSNCFRDGLLISALNPKITLFYMAAFPQFIQTGADAVTSSFALVFTHMAISVIWATVVAVVLSYTLNKTASRFPVHKLNQLSGIALIGMSVALLTCAVQAY